MFALLSLGRGPDWPDDPPAAACTGCHDDALPGPCTSHPEGALLWCVTLSCEVVWCPVVSSDVKIYCVVMPYACVCVCFSRSTLLVGCHCIEVSASPNLPVYGQGRVFDKYPCTALLREARQHPHLVQPAIEFLESMVPAPDGTIRGVASASPSPSASAAGAGGYGAHCRFCYSC